LQLFLNSRFIIVLFAPFLLGALTVLGFSPYNFTFINFFSFSILLFLIYLIKKKLQKNIEKKNLNVTFFI